MIPASAEGLNTEVGIGLHTGDRCSLRDLLYAALEEEEGAELSYRMVKEHFDELLRRLPQNGGARLIGVASAFCDEAHRADVEAFFQERAPRLPGGPRDLRQVQEQIRLCGALKEAQTAHVAALLRRR